MSLIEFVRSLNEMLFTLSILLGTCVDVTFVVVALKKKTVFSIFMAVFRFIGRLLFINGAIGRPDDCFGVTTSVPEPLMILM